MNDLYILLESLLLENVDYENEFNKRKDALNKRYNKHSAIAASTGGALVGGIMGGVATRSGTGAVIGAGALAGASYLHNLLTRIYHDRAIKSGNERSAALYVANIALKKGDKQLYNHWIEVARNS